MDWKRVACLVGVGAVALFGFTGCGGSDDGGVVGPDGSSAESTTPEATAPTKKEYVAAADAICKKANAGKTHSLFEQAVKLDKQAQASTDGTEIAKLEHQLSDITEKRADLKEDVTKDLKDLEAPDSGPAKDYLKTREQSAKQSHAVADAVETYADKLDQASADALTKAVAETTKINVEETKEAEKFGFKNCGQPIK